MRKKILCLIMFICLFLVGCDSNTYKEISYSEHERKIENKESFILFIGANTCSACTLFKDTLTEVIKDHKVVIYYIDLDNLSKEEKATFATYYLIESTPTTVFVENGEEKSMYNRINGAASYKKVVEILKNKNYIKGD